MMLRTAVRLLGLVLFLSAGPLAAQSQVEITAKTAKVKVRQETIATVRKGEQYRVVKTQGVWVAIVVGEGEKQKKGWILASAVRMLADPAVNDETAAPDEPVDVRLSVDLTQIPGQYGPQTNIYFKVAIGNESGEPVDFKVADLSLKVDDQPLPPFQPAPNTYFGGQIYTDIAMNQSQVGALPYLKDIRVPAGAVVEGWLAYNLTSLQQMLWQPGALANKTWVLEGSVGPHKVRLDLKEAEIAALDAKVRPSALDPSVQAIEIGSRINPLNIAKLLDALRTIPATDRGCVLVLRRGECLFDMLATQQFQQQQHQIFQFGPDGNMPVVSTEGRPFQNTGFRGYFSYGQMPMLPSEAAGVLTILGRRANTGESLIAHLHDKGADIRAAAAQALTRHLVEQGVVAALAASAADPEPSVRAAAVSALGGAPAQPGTRLDDSVDTAAVVKAMSDGDASVRNSAARTAAAFPCEKSRKELLKLLDDADMNVKIASATSLGTLRARDAVPKLKDLQNESNSQLKTSVIDALKNIGELTPAAAALAKLDGAFLQDADYAELGKAREKQAVPGLIARLRGAG